MTHEELLAAMWDQAGRWERDHPDGRITPEEQASIDAYEPDPEEAG